MATLESPEEWEFLFEQLNQSVQLFENIRDDTNITRYNDGTEIDSPTAMKNIFFWINGISSLDMETFQIKYQWVIASGIFKKEINQVIIA